MAKLNCFTVCIVFGLICGTVFALTPTELAYFNASAAVQLTVKGDVYEFSSTGYPDHDIDNSVNPNTASEQNYAYNITVNPVRENGKVYCTALGPIGFAKNGVPIFNALTAETTDAVKNEKFDDCKGHSTNTGAYHYHQLPSCVASLDVADEFIGIALDGHPIYGPNVSWSAELLTSKDLDLCHGQYKNGVYRYYITVDFPYALGCYTARPAEESRLATQTGGEGGLPPPPGGAGPPPGGAPEAGGGYDDTTCDNEDNGAQLCDCASGKTYIECEIASAESTCTSGGSDDDDPNMASKSIVSSCAVTIASVLAVTYALSALLIENGDVYEFSSFGYPDHEIDNSVNPNTASAQNYAYNITVNPVREDGKVYCTALGPIGFAKNGVPIFNALTADNTDAVKNEKFDDCKGHSTDKGAYHYHQFPSCVASLDVADEFIGIALDGHPIYGPNVSWSAELLTSKDLDLCHGLFKNGVYRYYITVDFPYALGCYTAKPAESMRGPPPEGSEQGSSSTYDKQTGSYDDTTCKNTDNGAQLCDCATGNTYIECEIASADATCTGDDSPNTAASLMSAGTAAATVAMALTLL